MKSHNVWKAALALLILGVAGNSVAEDLVACVHKRTGAVRIGKACKKPENRVTINTVGIQGPQGLQGPQGPRGVQGPAGEQFVDRFHVALKIPVGLQVIDYSLGNFGPFTLTVRCGHASTQSCDGIPYGASSDFVEICAQSSVNWVAQPNKPLTPFDVAGNTVKELLQFGFRNTGPTSPTWQTFTGFEPLLTRDPNFRDYVSVATEAAGLSVQGYDCVISGSIVHLPGPTN